jgi:hypothetical protein
MLFKKGLNHSWMRISLGVCLTTLVGCQGQQSQEEKLTQGHFSLGGKSSQSASSVGKPSSKNEAPEKRAITTPSGASAEELISLLSKGNESKSALVESIKRDVEELFENHCGPIEKMRNERPSYKLRDKKGKRAMQEKLKNGRALIVKCYKEELKLKIKYNKTEENPQEELKNNEKLWNSWIETGETESESLVSAQASGDSATTCGPNEALVCGGCVPTQIDNRIPVSLCKGEIGKIGHLGRHQWVEIPVNGKCTAFPHRNVTIKYARKKIELTCPADNYGYQLLCKTTGIYEQEKLIYVTSYKIETDENSDEKKAFFFHPKGCGDGTITHADTFEIIYKKIISKVEEASCKKEYKLGEPVIKTVEPMTTYGEWCPIEDYINTFELNKDRME